MTVQSDERWQDILAEIRKTLRKQQYDTWFRRVRFISSGGEELLLIVPNRFYADWLETNYRTTVEEAVQRVLGFKPYVRFEVGPEAAEPAEEAKTALEVQPAPPPPQLNKVYQLDTFVVGNCNRLAQAAARSVAECPGTVYNPLFVHSDLGMGKTHLLQAVCYRFMACHPGEAVAYVPAQQFVMELVEAQEHKALEGFRARYRSASLMALDDIHLLADRENSQEEFFHVFNELHSQKRQVVVSGDRPPQEIRGLSERLTSRLRWGLLVNLDRPDTETRLAILRQKAAARRLKVPKDVLEYVATRAHGSIRDLEAALVRLLAFASLSEKRVSVALARDALAAYASKPTGAPTVTEILDAVATHFGLRKADLVSKKRSRSATLPRQVGMYLARHLTSLSLGEIGKYVGGRDHTTVLYACEKIEKRKDKEASVARAVEEIAKALDRDIPCGH